jgi:hypothetical protein
MTHNLKIINFHVIEDKEIGLAEVYISSEIRPEFEQNREISPTDMNMLPEHMEQIFAVVNKTFFQEVEVENLDYSIQYIFISKDEVDISDYYDLIHKFLQERCDFYDNSSPVQFKVNSY